MSNSSEVSVEEALAVIEADRKRRLEVCKAEIEATLEKYQCRLESVIFVDGKAIPISIQIVAR